VRETRTARVPTVEGSIRYVIYHSSIDLSNTFSRRTARVVTHHAGNDTNAVGHTRMASTPSTRTTVRRRVPRRSSPTTPATTPTPCASHTQVTRRQHRERARRVDGVRVSPTTPHLRARHPRHITGVNDTNSACNASLPCTSPNRHRCVSPPLALLPTRRPRRQCVTAYDASTAMPSPTTRQRATTYDASTPSPKTRQRRAPVSYTRRLRRRRLSM
jgi:hypothetical protein